MKSQGVVFLFLLINSFCKPSYGQEEIVRYHHYTMAEGLSHNHIHDIEIDQDGKLWLATMDGINVYDGARFEKIETGDKVAGYLNISFDFNGVLWMIPKSSDAYQLDRLILYDPQKSKKIKVKSYLQHLDPNFDPSLISDAWNDNQGNMYVLDDLGRLFLYDTVGMQMVHESEPGDLFNKQPLQSNSITKCNTNTQTSSYINLYSGFSDTRSYENEILRSYYESDTLKCFVAGSKGSTDARGLTSQAIQPVELIEKQILIHPDPQFNIRNLNVDFAADGIWLSVHSQLYFISTLERNQIDTFSLRSISEHGVINVLKLDDFDQLWIGTSQGLVLRTEEPAYFQHFLTDQNMISREIFPMSDDSLLIASYHGLISLNIKNGTYKCFMQDRTTFGIHKVDHEHYLIGNHSYSLIDWVYGHHEPQKIYQPDSSLGAQVLDCFSDQNGKIWVANFKGIGYFNHESKQIEAWEFENGYCRDWVFSYHDPQIPNILWALSNNGIIEIDLENNIFTKIDAFEQIPISCVYSDPRLKGNHWIGTKNNGLFHWYERDGIIKHIDNSSGLSNNSVHAIFEDRHGRLWMPTNYGINTYNKNTGEINLYKEDDGLQVTEFNTYSSCMLPDSQLVFGSINGVVLFDPNEFSFPFKNRGEIEIESFAYFSKSTGRRTEKRLTKSANTITLSKNDFDVSIHIRASVNQLQKQEKYRYLISNVHQTWQYINGNTIFFEYLDYGDHNLLISKKQGVNDWSTPKLIKVSYQKPFYLSGWFFTFFSIIFFSVIILYQRILRNKLAKRNRLIQEQIDHQTYTLKARNEELFQSNRLNDLLFSILSHDLRSPILSMTKTTEHLEYLAKNKDVSRMLKLSKDLSSKSKNLVTLIEEIFHWAKQQMSTHQAAFKPYSLTGLINEVVEQLQSPIQEKHIVIHRQNGKETIAFTDPDILKIILRNILSNSIKFSNTGSSIDIAIVDQEYPIISIQDMAGGISPHILKKLRSNKGVKSTKGTRKELGFGFGLTICMHLIKKLGGEIEIHSQQGYGTSFHIHLKNRLSEFKSNKKRSATKADHFQ